MSPPEENERVAAPVKSCRETGLPVANVFAVELGHLSSASSCGTEISKQMGWHISPDRFMSGANPPCHFLRKLPDEFMPVFHPLLKKAVYFNLIG